LAPSLFTASSADAAHAHLLAAAAAAHWSPQPPAHRVRAALDLQKILHALVLGGAAFSGGVYPSLTADALWATLMPTLTDP
jgi:hypothetical protein